jgi:pyridoxamine 5'-phosphate oxidase
MSEHPPGMRADAPTSGLPFQFEGIEPEEAQLGPARANFAIILFHFTRIDWLYLANSGHRRACFSLGSAGWDGQWLVP